MTDTSTRLAGLHLRSPLIAASGTVGSVVDVAGAIPFGSYGAAVAKSVSGEPWQGRPAPRLSPAGLGMLNGIGIQNPGIDAWVAAIGPQLGSVAVPVWGSAVGKTPEEFARVAGRLARAGVAAIEVNLSCPNLEGETIWALDPDASARVVGAVRAAVRLPVGAKLSPNAPAIVPVAAAVAAAGADFVVLTNTIWGMGINLETRRPLLSGEVGGYSGPPLKPIALRCVWEVARALPELPIVGCGGVRTGGDVVEYLMAGARAVEAGTIHFAEPRAGTRIVAELDAWCARHGVAAVEELIGTARPW